MLFGKKKIIGLDVGTSTIKLAELDVTKKSAKLVSFGMAQTPREASAGGDIINSEKLAAAVEDLVAEVKSKRKLVSTAIWGSTVIVKKISIPRVDENLIGEQIRWEAEQYIPYDINQVNLEYEVLKSSASSGETMDLLLVAAFEESAIKCAETIAMAGLECAILDVGGFALANCYHKNYGSTGGQVVGLLNIGANITNFVVYENDEVVFCRDIPVGGDTYTGELQKGLGATYDEAEAIKLSLSTGGAAPEEASSIIQAVHEIVCDEVNGAMDFFLNTSDSGSIDFCYVTGGASKTPGLLEQLNKVISCEPLDPFKRVEYNKKVFSPSYVSQIKEFASVAIGLGLRELGDKS